MDKRISIWGTIASAIYLGVVAILLMSASSCQGMFCGSVIVLAIMPWSAIFENGLLMPSIGLELDGMVWFWTAVIINTIIIYSVFAFLQKRLHSR